MLEVKNGKYQHLESSTAILAKKIKQASFQRTGKINGTKQATTIIQPDNNDTINNKILIGNIQAENGNGSRKWKLLRT